MKLWHFTDLELYELARKHAASSQHAYAYTGANMSGWQPHDWVMWAFRDLADRAQEKGAELKEQELCDLDRQVDTRQVPLPLESQAFAGGPQGMSFSEWLKEMVYEGLVAGFEAARAERPDKEWRVRLRYLAGGIVFPSRNVRGDPCAKCGHQDFVTNGAGFVVCHWCHTPQPTLGHTLPATDQRTWPNHCRICGVKQDLNSCPHWVGKP
jgi:hypothetical protein